MSFGEIDPHEAIQTERTALFSISEISTKMAEISTEKDPKSLIVSTHPHIDYVGKHLLSHNDYPEESRTQIANTPPVILQQLAEHTVHNRHKYLCVIAAFESHHFLRDDFQYFLETMRDLTHGIVLVADYALQNLPEETAKEATCSNLEKRQQQIYGGYDRWLLEHASFSKESFMHAVHSAEWKSVRGFSHPQHKIGAVASPTLSQDELRKIYE